MWLGFLLILAIILAVVGVVASGVFAFVLVPIAAIIVVGAAVMSLWARATGGPQNSEQSSSLETQLPHSGHANVSGAPATPDQVVDARRQAQ